MRLSVETQLVLLVVIAPVGALFLMFLAWWYG